MGQLLTGAEILIASLKKEGVEFVFGHPGGAILDIYDKLMMDDSGIAHILVRHEQAGVHMAEGYAKATGRTGVVLVTSGPGVTNTVTGIADAFKDNIPVVVIAGQVPTSLIGKDAFQEIDALQITKSITKKQWSIRDVTQLSTIIHQAFHTAREGRPGPVLIEIPKNILTSKGDFEYAMEFDNGDGNKYSGGNESGTEKGASESAGQNNQQDKPNLKNNFILLSQAAEVIAHARKPVLCVGGGVINADATKELRELATNLNIPVAMTLHGLGAFPGNHSLSLGMLGTYGTYHANQAVSNCDVLISIGARLDNRVTSVASLFSPSSFKIHIDIDSTIINKTVPANLAIVGDAKETLHMLLEQITRKPSPSLTQPWLDEIKCWAIECPLRYENDQHRLRAGRVIEAISNFTQGEAILVTDVGQHQMVAAQFYRFMHPRSHITSGGLGTMGFALPAAIGASFGIKNKPVICIMGDGGFQMNMQELVTAWIHKLPIKFVIMNNHSLGMIRQLQDLFHREVYGASDLQNPDFIQLLKGFNYPVFSADIPEEIEGALQQAFAIDQGPVGIVFNIAKEDMVYPLVPPTKPLSEMIVGTTPPEMVVRLRQDIITSLLKHSLISSPQEALSLEHIDKGLINYIFSIKTKDKELIVKHAGDRARGKPSVRIDQKRLKNEFDAIYLYKKLCQSNHFPQILFFDQEFNLMAMEKVPRTYTLLETELREGKVDTALAASFGEFLAEMHNSTKDATKVKETINNIDMIQQIKIPFIYDNITSDPQEIEVIKALKNSLLTDKQCQVHGDFKPNNIFVNEKDFILIDFEQSYYGNPLLDFAYLPSAYLVLSFLHPEKQSVYFEAIRFFWKAYKKNILLPADEQAALQHLGVILLARVDGIIKYDFLQQNQVASILRKVAKKLILRQIPTLDWCLEEISKECLPYFLYSNLSPSKIL